MVRENAEAGLLADGDSPDAAPVADLTNDPPSLAEPDSPPDLTTDPPPSEDVADVPDGRLGALEDRVRRLEDALAQMQDVKQIETRVAERVTDQLARRPAATAIVAAEPTDRTRAAFTPPASFGSRPNLFLDLLADARAMYRIYTDPRYRLTWTARLAPPILVVLILTSQIWFAVAIIPWVGPIVDKAICLLLAFVLFKILFHEARRYRQTAPDLPGSLRL